MYQVKEGEGEVELCAIITSPTVPCPAIIPFKVKGEGIQFGTAWQKLLYPHFIVLSFRQQRF